MITQLLFSVCTLGGWLFFAMISSIAYRAAASARWHRVPARIIRRGYSESHDEGSTGCRAEIEYEYCFDGRSYRGDRVCFINVLRTRRGVLRGLRRLTRASGGFDGFAVFCDPRKPQESVVLPGLRLSVLVALGFSFFMASSFTFFLWLVLVR
ncbi:MAG: DUF3592 domain-containing protein [Phycisphaeraceae bacterium]|nr:DUF3592 domain-containing protein [Phycisphaeraceae bacterium]